MHLIRKGSAFFFTVLALSSVVAATAQATEGPFFAVHGLRLEKGATEKITGEASKAYVLTAGTVKITCTKQKLESAKLIGSSEKNSSTSEETSVLEGCTVTENGKNCKVEKGTVKTEPASDTLGYHNSVGKESEAVLIVFKPIKGGVFAKIKFEGSECNSKEAVVEGSVAAEALEEKEKAVLVGTDEPEGKTGFASLPSEAIKSAFTEKEGKREEIKLGLKAFGKTASFEGRSAIGVEGVEGNKAWGIHTKVNNPKVKATPRFDDFGPIKKGNMANVTINYTNDGPGEWEPNGMLSVIAFEGMAADFKFAAGTEECKGKIKVKGKCELKVTFMPENVEKYKIQINPQPVSPDTEVVWMQGEGIA